MSDTAPARPAIRLTLASLRPAAVAGLAVLWASVGGGDATRRSAMAWMMGSWGARLAIQTLYTPGHPELLDDEPAGARVRYGALIASAAFFSLPAFLASINADSSLSAIELGACALWLAAFAGETTADRQLLRFASLPAHAGLACRAGVWRFVPHAHAVCETLIWCAFALFACASPWGWTALACPAAMAYLMFAPILRPRR